MMLPSPTLPSRPFAPTTAGCPDGTYTTGDDRQVVKTGNVIMLADGSSLAGSAITMLDAFRNLVSIGLSLVQASEMTAARQADYLGLSELGALVPGYLASFAVLSQKLDLEAVWLRGSALAR